MARGTRMDRAPAYHVVAARRGLRRLRLAIPRRRRSGIAVALWRCGDVDGDVLAALLRAIMRDGTDRVLDLATGNRYVARVEEVSDERAA